MFPISTFDLLGTVCATGEVIWPLSFALNGLVHLHMEPYYSRVKVPVLCLSFGTFESNEDGFQGNEIKQKQNKKTHTKHS